MDYTSLATTIVQVGFSIVMCLLMWKYISEDTKATREVITDVKVTLQELIDKLDSHLDDDKKGTQK